MKNENKKRPRGIDWLTFAALAFGALLFFAVTIKGAIKNDAQPIKEVAHPDVFELIESVDDTEVLVSTGRLIDFEETELRYELHFRTDNPALALEAANTFIEILEAQLESEAGG